MGLLTEEDKKATYLGDGAYALNLGYAIEIFTSNGITKDNVIILENDAIDVLVRIKEEA